MLKCQFHSRYPSANPLIPQQNEAITALSFAEASTGAHAVIGTSQGRILLVTVPSKKTTDDFVKVSVARQSKGPPAGWNIFSRFWGNSTVNPIRACRLAPNGLVYGLTASSLVSSDGTSLHPLFPVDLFQIRIAKIYL